MPSGAAKSTSRPFAVFDGDSHVLEPAAIWERFLAPEYRTAARSAFWRGEGEVRPVVVLNGKLAAAPFMPDPASYNIPREGVWRPGMTSRDVAGLDPKRRHPANPGGSDPVARLADMDAMGIDRALLFPTYFGEYLPLVQDPHLAQALATAYNDWALDFSRAAPDRLFPVALLPMQEINAAVHELRRVVKLGFRAAFIRPVFVSGRYPHQRYYYPLWKEVQEAGVLWCSHPTSGTSAPETDASAAFVERVTANLNIGHPVAEVIAPAMDNGVMLLGMMAEGLLEKFPDIRFYLAHSKASWIHLFLEKIESYLWLSSQAEPVSLHPDRVFMARQTLATFDRTESAIWEMPDAFEKLAAWGSLYPSHATSTATETIEDLLARGVAGATVEKLMGGNLASVLGLEPALRAGKR